MCDRPSAGGLPLVLLVSLAVYAAMVWRFDFLCDDAYITFRYAANWADGHGFVYHPGIEQPVEGYSEFLWALLLGLGAKVGVAPELLSRIVSVLAGAGLVAGAARLLHGRFAGATVPALLAAVFLASAPPVAVWATGGMATMPAAALGFWLYARTHRQASEEPGEEGWLSKQALALGGIGAALALVRADGALLVALVLGPAILLGLLQRRPAAWRPAFVGASLAALAFGLHMAWRWSVYGDWVPNTARVKLGMTAAAVERGGDYVMSCLLSMPGLLTATLLLPVGAWLARARVGSAAAVGALVVPAGVIGYSITSGGDFMAFARFLLPALPFLALGLGAVLASLHRRSALLGAWLGLVVVGTTVTAAFDVHPVPLEVRQGFDVRHNQRLSGVKEARSELAQWRNMRDRAIEWARLGRALGEHAPPGSSVVYGAVGAIGYESGLFVFDQNGLVTREVAMREPHAQLRSPGHDKTVPPTFFLKDNPTYLTAGVAPEQAIGALRQRVGPIAVLGPTERAGEVVWVLPRR